MAFSTNNRDPTFQGRSTQDSSHNPGNKLFSYKSFTDALKFQTRHAFEVSPNVEIGEFKPLNAYSTFIEAKERNSIVIDCAQFLGMEFKEKSILKVLREQYPKALGLKPRIVGKNKRKAIEIGFSTENACKEALLKEFQVNGKTIEVNKTLSHDAKVINIGITELPLLEDDILKDALVKTFEQYGDVLNVGIAKSGDSDWFTGRGYATINSKNKEKDFKELTPQVTLEGTNRSLNLVWSQMKPICPDCHTDNHNKFNCPKKSPKLCHRCNSPNHLQAGCPTAPWNKEKSNNNETNKPVAPENSSESDVSISVVPGTNTESRLMQILNKGKRSNAETSNYYKTLDEGDSNNENEDTIDEETTSIEVVNVINLDKESSPMTRSSSEQPAQTLNDIKPRKSVSTPRSLRSDQQQKLGMIKTRKSSVDKGKGKTSTPNVKRNLEEAISPEAREASTPTNKRSSKQSTLDAGRLASLD
ncbi:hypothetical protein INT46_004164 [Mucor plumbeus]|uniref:RRM domain-containing protein n=1 Tax=Mucor plumbeus TaxID=97098 RepID=A0A8H7RU86_9FUNG|nr:hypothetical protein INT46_004164 [Mucor plumbeus]